jgi:hypothetical protein
VILSITIKLSSSVCLAVFEAIQDDLKQGFIEQNRYPEMGAGGDKVDIGFGCDAVSGAHGRIEIR